MCYQWSHQNVYILLRGLERPGVGKLGKRNGFHSWAHGYYEPAVRKQRDVNIFKWMIIYHIEINSEFVQIFSSYFVPVTILKDEQMLDPRMAHKVAHSIFQ